MSVKDFHAAGFKGSLPKITSKPSSKLWISEHLLLALLAFILILLLIGFVKATFGYTGNRKIGHFGLKSLIFKPKQIKRYFEPELKGNKVQYDVEGYPINPETNHHARVLSEEIIFLLNILFFFVWPLKAITDCFLKRKENKESKTTSEKSEFYSEPDYETDDSDNQDIFTRETPSQNEDTDNSPKRPSLQSEPTTEDESQQAPTRPPRRYPKRQLAEEQYRKPDYFDATDTGQSDREPESSSSDDEKLLPETEPFLLNSAVTGLNSAVSDSVLEFVASRHDGEMPLVNKELARWQKGAARINAFKLSSKSSIKVE